MSTALLADRMEEVSSDTTSPTSNGELQMRNEPPVAQVEAVPAQTDKAPLLAASDAERFRTRWDETQRGFVDEPRTSVESADQLVAELMQSLATSFAAERASLEQQWEHGDDVDTEQLRMALRRYRSFFERLLSV
jgi:hypothetical protein